MADEKVTIKIGPGRVSFPSVFEPIAYMGKGDKTYNITLLIPKDDTAAITAIKKVIAGAVTAKYGDLKSVPKNFRYPLNDGDKDVETKGEAYAGNYYIHMKSKLRPVVCDKTGKDIEADSGDFYPGCWAKVSAQPFLYTDPTPGLSFWFNGVIKLKDDDAFGGAHKSAKDIFSDDIEAENANSDTADGGTEEDYPF